MMNGNEDQPSYILGTKIGRVLAISSWLAASIFVYFILYFIYYDRMTENGYVLGRVTTALIVVRLSDFLSIISAFLAAIAVCLSWYSFLRFGNVSLFDSHLKWNRAGRTRNVPYSDLTEARVKTTSTASSYVMPGSLSQWSWRWAFKYTHSVSFRIESHPLIFRFDLGVNRGIDQFLRKRVPDMDFL